MDDTLGGDADLDGSVANRKSCLPEQPDSVRFRIGVTGKCDALSNLRTVELANFALKALRTPSFVGGVGAVGGGSASVRALIGSCERLVGFLEGQDIGELTDAAARADVQAALREAIEVVQSTDKDWRSPKLPGMKGIIFENKETQKPGKHRSRNRQPGRKFPVKERSALISNARRIESHTQVAIYRAETVSRENSRSDDVDEMPMTNSGSGSGPLKYSKQAEHGKLLRKLSLVRHASRGPVQSSTSSVTVAGSDNFGDEYGSGSSAACDRPFPWEIDPNYHPFTPLRERTVENIPDNASVPCVWKGQRSAVKILRGDFKKLKSEADILWSLGKHENMQRMFGAYYEEGVLPKNGAKATTRGSTTTKSSGVGYIILEHSNGASLDKSVRENRLKDNAAQVRIFDKIVAALSYAASLDPPVEHHELHPGNILLVPRVQQPENRGQSDASENKCPSPKKYGDEATSEIARQEGTLRISNHTVKVLAFVSDEANNRPNQTKKKKRSNHGGDCRFAAYSAPEIMAPKYFGFDKHKAEPVVAGERPPGAETARRNCTQSRAEVWSLGWIMYYMTTGKHPNPEIVEAFTGQDIASEQQRLDKRIRKDLSRVPTRIRELILMCVLYDPSRRASLREVKRQVVSLFASMVFSKGVSLVEQSTSKGMAMMDKATSIKAPKASLYRDQGDMKDKHVVNPAGLRYRKNSSAIFQEGIGTLGKRNLLRKYPLEKMDERKALGMRGLTKKALSLLPLVVVRRVEWEATAKQSGLTDFEISSVRRVLVNHVWSRADVKDGSAAIRYLESRDSDTPGRNAAAISAIGWIYRWGAGGVRKNVPQAIALWEIAANLGDAEAANGLGLIYHHGRPGIEVNGQLARAYYNDGLRWGYAAAAVNLGVMMHDGAAGVAVDGPAARDCYQMASNLDDGVAANNLGLLYLHGAPGVPANGVYAMEHFELSISRGELHHARRNLGEMLWEGAPGIEADPERAAENLVIALVEGDEVSRSSAKEKLLVVLDSPESGQISENTREQGRIALDNLCG